MRTTTNIIILTIALLTPLAIMAASLVPSMSNSLSELDYYLPKRETYIENRKSYIDSLKTELHTRQRGTTEWFEAIDKISENYTAFNNDSTLTYYETGINAAREFGCDSIEMCMRIKHLAYLPLTGFITETVQAFEAIDTTAFSPEMKILYLDNGRQMYNYISAFYRSDPSQAKVWEQKELETKKLLIDHLPDTSSQYKYCYAEYLYQTGKYKESKAVSLKLLKEISPECNLYARVCHNLADIAKTEGRENERIYYLTQSAITDIRSATLEVTSLQELGVYLFDHDDLEHAYTYLSVALENAVACHAPLRVLEISETLPLIESTHYKQNQRSYRLLLYLFIAACLSLLCLALSLILLKRQFNRKTMLQNRLEGANQTKEVYISHFLNLCSSYMDKLSSFNQLVTRKISAGQVEDLYKITKSSRFMEEQSKEFYEVFDNAFLHIYPTFIDDVNRLLMPDKQIVLRDDELLNTDLRILALMRLGMEDANRVAHMLNYSVNTIYAYRNRLKNRAINRDTFETDLMKISSI